MNIPRQPNAPRQPELVLHDEDVLPGVREMLREELGYPPGIKVDLSFAVVLLGLTDRIEVMK